MFQARDLHPDKESFVTFWRSNVMKLALLLHQLKGGVPVGGEMVKVRAAGPVAALKLNCCAPGAMC